jgi:hypothetical protein
VCVSTCKLDQLFETITLQWLLGLIPECQLELVQVVGRLMFSDGHVCSTHPGSHVFQNSSRIVKIFCGLLFLGLGSPFQLHPFHEVLLECFLFTLFFGYVFFESTICQMMIPISYTIEVLITSNTY